MWLDGTLHVGGGFTSGDGADARLYSLRPGVDSTWRVTDTPTYSYALAIHNSELLLVGGKVYSTYEITNKVFTMKDGKFCESHPPMKVARYSPSVVSNGSALMVAGGRVTTGVYSVEVLKDGQWTTCPSIPISDGFMKSALHGDLWYIILMSNKAFRVSLQSLISGTDSSPWETLPNVPKRYSAAAFFGGQLLSIGGENRGRPTTDIYALSSSTQSWEHVADLPIKMKQSSAVVLPTGELLVFGGGDTYSENIFGSFLKGKNVPFFPNFFVYNKYTFS